MHSCDITAFHLARRPFDFALLLVFRFIFDELFGLDEFDGGVGGTSSPPPPPPPPLPLP